MKDITSLLVVYQKRDEEIFSHLKDLVERNDDGEDYEIVGTEDGTVRVIKCTEDIWLVHKKAGREKNLAEKVIFIGDIKGSENPISIYREHGISYGKIDNDHMKINVDENYIWNREEYSIFLSELKSVVISADEIKASVEKKSRTKASMVVGGILFPPLQIYNAVALAIDAKDARKDSKLMRKQMLLYGVSKLYYNDLEKFIKQ